MTTWLHRLTHHLRRHQLAVRWAHPGWEYRCSCTKTWGAM